MMSSSLTIDCKVGKAVAICSLISAETLLQVDKSSSSELLFDDSFISRCDFSFFSSSLVLGGIIYHQGSEDIEFNELFIMLSKKCCDVSQTPTLVTGFLP